MVVRVRRVRRVQRVPRRGFALLALAVSASAALAACSSSGSPSSDTGGGGSTTPAASNGSATAVATARGSSSTNASPSGTPIKIGVVCACSSSFGPQLTAGRKTAEAWAKAVNASGGLGGHPVDLITKDDGGNPGTSVTDVESLISQHVAAIIDDTILDSAWQKQVDAAKVPVIAGGLASNLFFSDPNWYPSGQTTDNIIPAMVATVKASGATNLGLLVCAEAPQCASTIPLAKAAAKKLGIAMPYSGTISATAPNYTAQCVAAKDAGVTALWLGGAAATYIRVAEDCANQDYKPVILVEGIGYASSLQQSSALKNSLWAAFPEQPLFSTAPSVQAMNAALDKYEPGLRSDPTAFSQFAVASWTAGLLIAHAVKNAGVPSTDTIDAATLTKGLNRVRNDTLGGFAPPLTLRAGQNHSIPCWFTAHFVNGKPVITNGGKPTCPRGT